ncbi:HsdM family class I SAM-dependent methyltransferase [Paenibacillus sp. IITD108]|uniref:HsdM family class I SAM-dependent methyltransferase n=1 Tax=Paenibacillus sp. IITD108 TaxID=3116649 RepID=UPI002F42F02F
MHSSQQYEINMNKTGLQLAERARDLVHSKAWHLLTKEEKKFVRNHYMGRQVFRGFYTDLQLSRLLTMLLKPLAGRLLEPSCGTGRLLEYLDRSKLQIVCCEIDRQAASICKSIYPEITLLTGDTLAKIDELRSQFDYVLANPPWGLRVNQYYDKYELFNVTPEKRSTALFLELCINALKPGGKCAIILPESYKSEEFSSVNNYVQNSSAVLAEIHFPKHVFFSSNILVSGYILILEKTTSFRNSYISSLDSWDINDLDWNEKLIENIVCEFENSQNSGKQ